MIDRQIEQLTAQKSDKSKFVEAARLLRGSLPNPTVEVKNEPRAEAKPSNVRTPARNKPRKIQRITWKDVVKEAVLPAQMGLTYAELRSKVAQSVLGEKLDRSDKGYHNALSRLANANEIVRDHGRVFTPEAFERFMQAVEAGKVSTTVPQEIARSPMGEAILIVVDEKPGELNGKGVIRELRRDAEFNASLTPHETGAYNIIARLCRRGQLVRLDDGTLLPGKNFPHDLVDQVRKENEAPNGNTAGASEAEEGATSSDDTHPLFRVVK